MSGRGPRQGDNRTLLPREPSWSATDHRRSTAGTLTKSGRRPAGAERSTGGESHGPAIPGHCAESASGPPKRQTTRPENPTIRRIPADSAPVRRVCDQARRRVSVRITPRAVAGGPRTGVAARRTRPRHRRLLRLRHDRPRRLEHLGVGHRPGRVLTLPRSATASAAHEAGAQAHDAAAPAAAPDRPGATPASRTDDDAASPGDHPRTAPGARLSRTGHPGPAGAHSGARAPRATSRPGARAGPRTLGAAPAIGPRARRPPALPPRRAAPAEGRHVRRHDDAGDHRPRSARDRDPAPPLPLNSP